MIHDLSTFAALKQRMRFLQSRQKVLAENVANADTPATSPRISPRSALTRQRAVRMPRAVSACSVQPGGRPDGDEPHAYRADGQGAGSVDRGASYETRPSGNAVNLEDEMLKVSRTRSISRRRRTSTSAALPR